MTIVKPCPECGATLVERVNRATNEPFLGCSRWPECKHTEPLPESVKLRRAGQQELFGEETK
jgi:ssDNA-binding Zn-finger/Zn-ribbon topoisomerase 1